MVERVLFDSRPASKIHVKYVLFITYFPYVQCAQRHRVFMCRTRSRDRVGPGTIIFRRNNVWRRPHVDPIVPPSISVRPPCTALLLLLLYFAQSVFVPALCLCKRIKTGAVPYTVACDLTRTRKSYGRPGESVRTDVCFRRTTVKTERGKQRASRDPRGRSPVEAARGKRKEKISWP